MTTQRDVYITAARHAYLRGELDTKTFESALDDAFGGELSPRSFADKYTLPITPFLPLMRYE